RHALFLATTVISKTRSGRAVGDAGLKSQAAESGLPLVHSLSGVEAIAINDEHVVLADSGDLLSINDQIALIPSHCDPTCNLHDWYVCVRAGIVEDVWPVSARG